MTILGIVIMPEGTTGAEPGKPYRVQSDTLVNLRKKVGIEFPEQVKTQTTYDAGFLGMIDSDGMTRGLTVNPVAQAVLNYPQPHTIRGPVVFLSEGVVYDDDGFPEPDFVSLSESGKNYIMDFMVLPTDHEFERLPKFELKILPPEDREVPKFRVSGISGELTQDEVLRYLIGDWKNDPQ